MKLLIAGVAEIGIELDPVQQGRFRSFFEFLEERGRVVNLTAVHGWDAVRDDLFLRSLRILAVRQGPLAGAIATQGEGVRVLDVGTGAGIPGLALKLALPGLDVTLLDATRKKADFVSELIERLGIDRARAVNARAEKAGQDPAFRERFDVVVARAVAQLPELAELTLPFTRVGGVSIAQKGVEIEAEIRSSEYAARELGARLVGTQIVDAPGPLMPDTLVIWEKDRATPGQYPRRPGVPHHRPLLAPRSKGARAGGRIGR
ncbi:MAG: 16S rRNA (guanine(527)-N(7))-methyltransferase RsmG [Chloroflexi bacterium]|nr:16S rRNA (guanine(527)-N(7))-methyltransferase RsmG [Chloroflexota bacterium]